MLLRLSTTAVGSVTTTSTVGSGSDPAESGGIDGTWTVDSESGEFDYESATGTLAGFRVDEELSTIGSSTAVGRTGDVTGSLSIEDGTVTAASFSVDLTTITTNESRRDGKVERALDVDTYPTATFSLTEPIDLPPEAASRAAVTLDRTRRPHFPWRHQGRVTAHRGKARRQHDRRRRKHAHHLPPITA